MAALKSDQILFKYKLYGLNLTSWRYYIVEFEQIQKDFLYKKQRYILVN